MYPPPAPPPPRAGPSRGWFWLALALVLSAPLIVLASILVNLAVLTEGTDPRVAEPGGKVGLTVTAGTEYRVYHNAEAALPPTVTCRFGADGPAVALRRHQPWSASDTVDEGDLTYRYVGTFVADRDEVLVIGCDDLEARWLVQRDDGGYLVIGLACCASVTLIIVGLLVLGVTAAARTRAQNRAGPRW